MYRPNFCAECGERVLRARWHVWTSRRFCATCARRFRRKNFLARLALASAIACAGFLLGRLASPAPPPLTIERGTLNLASPPGGQATPPSDGAGRSAGPKHETIYGPDGTDAERPTDPSEIVSICGARTKKGTPCQRRVRGTGRCWQHKKLR